MDPDATLARMREICSASQQPGADDAGLLAELVDNLDALDNWLTEMGFLPADWSGPGGGDREGRHP